jgi:hypothetical protein
LRAFGFSLFLLILAGCGGNDDREAVAPEWCRQTTYVLAEVDRAGAGVPYDALDEWIEFAPNEVQPSTEQAAQILRNLLPEPPPPAFVEARTEIEAFARENCPGAG